MVLEPPLRFDGVLSEVPHLPSLVEKCPEVGDQEALLVPRRTVRSLIDTTPGNRRTGDTNTRSGDPSSRLSRSVPGVRVSVSRPGGPGLEYRTTCLQDLKDGTFLSRFVVVLSPRPLDP